MKVELAQLAGRDNDTAYNLERALAAIAGCAADTHLIMFPESHLMGFPSAATVAAVAEPLDGPSVSAIVAAARERNVAVVIGTA
jgi:(R)-amidase